MNNQTIEHILKKYESDKANQSPYIKTYEMYFEPIRMSAKAVLEIGIRGGPSLRAWREYFSNAIIHGIDIEPKNKKCAGDNVYIHIGNQGDRQFLAQVVMKIAELNEKHFSDDSGDGLLDVVIDDGSHVNTLTLTSFEMLWPHIRPGGIYIIEDLGCSYINLDKQNVRHKAATASSGWHGMHLVDNSVSYNNDRALMNQFFLEKIKVMDFEFVRDSLRREAKVNQLNDIDSLYFAAGICAITKKAV